MKTNPIYICVITLVALLCAVTSVSAFAGDLNLSVARHFHQSRAALETLSQLYQNEESTGEELLAAANNFSTLYGEGLGRALTEHEELAESGATSAQLATHMASISNAYTAYINSSRAAVVRVTSRHGSSNEKTQIQSINKHVLAFFSVTGAGLYITKLFAEAGNLEMAQASFVGVLLAQVAAYVSNRSSQHRFRKVRQAAIESMISEHLIPSFMQGVLREYPFTGNYEDLAHTMHERTCELLLQGAPTAQP